MTSGLTSLQAALAIFHPGALLDAVNSYSQQPVRFSCDKHVHVVPSSGRIWGNPAKFGASAVNVNTDDDITKEQIHGLRNVISEFPDLWDVGVGRSLNENSPEGRSCHRI